MQPTLLFSDFKVQVYHNNESNFCFYRLQDLVEAKDAENNRSELLGFFKTFSEQDLDDMLRLKKATVDNSVSKTLPLTTNLMVSKIYGHSLFSLFSSNIEVLKKSRMMLETEKYDEIMDIDDRPLDHPLLKKVSMMLSLFEPVDFKVL